MSTIDQDTFQRANQTGWNPASSGSNWAALAGAPTLSISSNEGVCAVGSTDAPIQLGSLTAGTLNISVRVSISSLANGGLIFRSDGTASNYYRLLIENGTFYFQKCVATVFTTVQSFVLTGFVNGDLWWQRGVMTGGLCQASAWKDGTAEPTLGSQISASDSTFSTGNFGVTAHAGTMDFDHFLITDNQTASINVNLNHGRRGIWTPGPTQL